MRRPPGAGAPECRAVETSEPARTPKTRGDDMSDQDTPEKEDFGQILAEFEQEAPAKSDDPAVGEKVSGRILSIGEEWGFVDLGSKSEGRVAAAHPRGAAGS